MTDVNPFDGSVAESTGVVPVPPSTATKRAAKQPFYPRLLRLRHIAPNAWQRAALGEGAVGIGVLLSMADLASAWTIVALPVAVAGIVKAHDLLQGLLETGQPPPADDNGAGPAEGAGADR